MKERPVQDRTDPLPAPSSSAEEEGATSRRRRRAKQTEPLGGGRAGKASSAPVEGGAEAPLVAGERSMGARAGRAGVGG